MKKILIGNIGNRNLKLNGKFITKVFDAEDKISFREQTFSIWQQILKNEFDEERLESVIINEVIEKEKQNLEKVYLISSDMPETLRNDQDTIFAGEILSHLFKKQYKNIEFENYPVRESVFKYDDLFRAYRPFLLKLKNENPDKKIIYCDAGGTSQQKFALKISLEYLFKPDEFSVYYVEQKEKGMSRVSSGESYEYRKIIDIEHAAQAIRSGAYPLSLEILGTHYPNRNKFPFSLIQFLDLRSRLFDDAEKLARSIAQGKEVPVFVKNFAKQIPVGNYDGWEDLLEPKHFFRLCEILIASQWKYSLGIIEQALHLFSMFMESYTHYIIERQYGYKMYVFKDSALAKLSDDLKNKKLTLPENINPQREGMPLNISIAGTIQGKKNEALMPYFKQLNSFFISDNEGIDTIRNKYAHTGKGKKRKDFEASPLYANMIKCYEIFEIDFFTNHYEEMHDEVCELIRK